MTWHFIRRNVPAWEPLSGGSVLDAVSDGMTFAEAMSCGSRITVERLARPPRVAHEPVQEPRTPRSASRTKRKLDGPARIRPNVKAGTTN